MGDMESATEALTTADAGLTNLCPSITNTVPVPDCTAIATWPMQGDLLGAKDSVLPREFRQSLYKHFARIEHEFEREYRRLYTENLALHERLEKPDDGDHSESTTLAKKLGASMLSQRIKQQYKQSTSRLVSSLRQSSGHSTANTSLLSSPAVPMAVNPPTGPGSTIPVSTTSPAPFSFAGSTGGGAGGAVVSSCAGTFSSHAGSWQLVHRLTAAHRDGIWEVTPYGKLVATASADNTVRLWSNDSQMNCLLVYLGHSGSVNSVRFRSSDNLLLASSGDGTAHLLRLPYDALVKAASAIPSSQTGGTLSATAAAALEAAASSLAAEVAGSTGISVGTSSALRSAVQTGPESEDVVGSHGFQTSVEEGGSPVRSSVNVNCSIPIQVRHPHAIFQSVNLGSGILGGAQSSSMLMDSAPLSAADFLTGRDQLVTAGWDRLGRIYDLATGQEVSLLTGHDHQLTDVRCAPGGASLVVTSSRDGTFRLWDFRQAGMRVHVQQAHTQTVSTTHFLPANPTKHLISAGSDHLCRIWDLRQTRGPIVSIRTDSGINRIAVSGAVAMNISGTATGDSVLEQSGEDTAPEAQASTNRPTAAVGPSAVPPTSALAGSLWPTNYSQILALPLNNRGIKFYDLSGTRLGRLPQSSSRGHSRIVTSVAWATDGLCNFFSTGFDSRLLAWQIHLSNS